MTLIDLEDLAGRRHETLGSVYLVGIGGPMDESGIGDVASFQWRFCVLARDGLTPIVIGFRSMPSMMSFTRTVNGAEPFTIPTEAFHADLKDIGPISFHLALDPSPDEFMAWKHDAELVMRIVPELER